MSRYLLPAAAGVGIAATVYYLYKKGFFKSTETIIVERMIAKLEDSVTTSAIIDAFKENATFLEFSKKETADVLGRDAEDAEKLAAGIQMAVKKNVLAANPPVEPCMKIDVLGKTADTVANAIIAALGAAPSHGCVLVLQGLSGTGKGTTVAKLQDSLPKCVSWSNGNVFRSLTLLAVTKCEQTGTAFGEAALTPALLAECMGCLKFGKFKGGKFDIHIDGLGLNLYVSEVANTTLKEPKVSKNIPTVAKMTQGEVIKFAGGAAEQMRADGFNVLMEGRSQTLDYVRTPHRFELTLSDSNIIGMRRAAQRMLGEGLKRHAELQANPQTVMAVLQSALGKMAK